MPNIVANIPNFVSGVSQQPRTMRFSSQAEESINAFPSIVEGLGKRQPSQHIKRLYTTYSGSSFSAFIDKSETEKYITEIRNGTIRVWDTDGNEKTIYYGGATPSTTPTGPATTYLTSATNDFKTLTIADYTFVLNKGIAPKYTSNLAIQDYFNTNYKTSTALYTLKQLAENCSFTYRIDVRIPTGQANAGSQRSIKYVVSIGKLDSTGTIIPCVFTMYKSDAFASYSQIRTETLNYAPKDALNTPNIQLTLLAFIRNGTCGGTFASSSGTITPLQTAMGYGANWWQGTIGPTYYLYTDIRGTPNTNGFDALGNLIWSASSEDSASGAILNLNWENVQSFADLPKYGLKGTIYKIVGYPQDTTDDYWVKFTIQNNTYSIQAEGQWIETIAPGEYYEIDPNTMPWALITLPSGNMAFTPMDGSTRTYGSDTFTAPKWANKICGDSESNKIPSFLNLPTSSTNKISDIFFYKNRLGFLSGENIVFSEAGEYFNFFKTTITQNLDSDPIDIASTSANVSDLSYAIPFFDRLLIFSENAQFSLLGQETLTAKTASIQLTTSYSSISNVKPVSAGKFVYFPYFKNNYSGVREYYLNPENAFMEGNDISVNVPKYIEGKIFKMAVSDTESILAVLTSINQNNLYIYKYMNAGSERIQSAWTKFSFEKTSTILNIFFKKEILYMLIARSDGIYLEKIDFQAFQNKSFMSYIPRMDRLCSVSSNASYNTTGVTYTQNSPSTGKTTITFPFSFGTSKPVAVLGANPESDMSLLLNGNENSFIHSSNSQDFYKNTLPNSFLIACFIKPTTLNNQVIFNLDKGEANPSSGTSAPWKSVQLNIQEGYLKVYLKTGDSTGYTTYTTGLVANSWNFVAVVFNSPSNALYVKCNATTMASISTAGSPYYLDANAGNFKGLIDNIAILDTYTNLNSYYQTYGDNAGSSPLYNSLLNGSFSSNLISYFSFNQENGDLIKDIHSNRICFDLVKGKYLYSEQVTNSTQVYDIIPVESYSTTSGITSLVINGLLSTYNGPIYFGVPYTMLHTINPVSLRSPGQKGGQILVSSAGYQLKYGYLAYTNSKNFYVITSSSDGAQGNNYRYNFVSNTSLKTGIFRFPLFLKSENAFITFLNSSPYPSNFVSADFEGTLSNSYQRA